MLYKFVYQELVLIVTYNNWAFTLYYLMWANYVGCSCIVVAEIRGSTCVQNAAEVFQGKCLIMLTVDLDFTFSLAFLMVLTKLGCQLISLQFALYIYVWLLDFKMWTHFIQFIIATIFNHRAEALAQELKDLQAELGDYNTVSWHKVIHLYIYMLVIKY